jgi:hypothetical protein
MAEVRVISEGVVHQIDNAEGKVVLLRERLPSRGG